MSNNVVSLFRAAETSEESVSEPLTTEEQAAALIARELPVLLNDIAALVARPFRLFFDPNIETACTDCLAEVRIAPSFFLDGEREVGFGIAYHECGHIRWSPFGVKLLERARKEGGETLQHLTNLVLDRRDDMLTTDFATGFAERLRNRLPYLCTMSLREAFEPIFREWVARERSVDGSKEAFLRFLAHWRPEDPYEDFFYACKWHRSPRFPQVRRAMKFVARKELLDATPEKLLWIAKQVRELLGEEREPAERRSREADFTKLVFAFLRAEGGKLDGQKVSGKVLRLIYAAIANFLAVQRENQFKLLLSRLRQGTSSVGPISVGKAETVPVRQIPPSARFAPAYQGFRSQVGPLVDPLVRKLRKLDSPSEYTLHGRDEGEIDFSESARIATGLSGYHEETVVERNIDAEIHLAIDASGSMMGERILNAKKIATMFSEAILALQPMCVGKIWGFNSDAIYDFGKLGNQSGFVALEGDAGNSDTHLLRVVGKELGKSKKRRKLLLVLADDGPDSADEVRQIAAQLLARGILVVHLLVGVHGSPAIYPYELLYGSMGECLAQFGDLLTRIVENLK